MASEHATGTPDPTYNIISVIYHGLQGAETCEQYIRDAEGAGDSELAEFLRAAQGQLRDISARGKQLLSGRLTS